MTAPSNLEYIRRDLLKLSQEALAKALGMAQSNVSMYERRGQRVPSDVAEKLISYAASQGIEIDFNTVYGKNHKSS